jgi:hypothetical protein
MSEFSAQVAPDTVTTGGSSEELSLQEITTQLEELIALANEGIKQLRLFTYVLSLISYEFRQRFQRRENG